jgi:hypothetical protein
MSKSETLAWVKPASYFVILSSLLDILRFAFSFTFGLASFSCAVSAGSAVKKRFWERKEQ